MLSNKCKKGKILPLTVMGILFVFTSLSSQVLSQTLTLNGKQYTFSGGKWYVEDAGSWFEVVQDVITVKFKPAVSQAIIDSLNAEKGVSIIRKARTWYYDLRLPEGGDPIEMAREYLITKLERLYKIFYIIS